MHLTNHKFKMKNCRKEYCWITEQTEMELESVLLRILGGHT